MEDLDEEEEEEGSVASGPIAGQKEGTYEIIGTLKDKTQSKPDFVKEIIDVRFCNLPAVLGSPNFEFLG